MQEKPILEIKNLRKKFGEGCDHCLENPKSFKINRCPKCGTVWGCKDVTFEVYPGEILGVVGESGSGKSTVMSLIARFWDTTKGSIKIGGKDIKEVNPDSLLKNISMVFQDVYLINDSMYENIRIGQSLFGFRY